MAEPLLTATGLGKRYGGRAVLRGVSLTLAEGERVALMGPSGSGKSTLLNCLGGVDRPDDGEIVLDGLRLTTLGADALAKVRREKVGTVFQFFHLLPTLTAAENVELPLQLLGVARVERAARVAELLAAVGLTERAAQFPSQLSGGEQQRVSLARALAGRPRLLLADEPTGSLDTRTGAAVLELLEQLCERYRTALVLVTHDAACTRICHRVIHLRDGEVV